MSKNDSKSSEQGKAYIHKKDLPQTPATDRKIRNFTFEFEQPPPKPVKQPDSTSGQDTKQTKE